MCRLVLLTVVLTCSMSFSAIGVAQEKSVKPGINDTFRDPNPQEFLGKFEVESREVYARRKEIAAACQIQPGQTVADIGAGTGLFTRMFADTVGTDGRVIAVDIAQKFLDHIVATTREAGQRNVETVLCKADSTELPPDSVDVAFICDTYHHFEFPLKTMASLHRALKPGGRVVLVDFRRVEGTSTDWVMNHVRAGQEVFEAEIVQSGFKKVYEERELLKENYFAVFEKAASADSATVRRPGRGRGMGRGPGPEMRADQDVFHFLLDHHAEIRRSVKRLDNGVETLTESDNKDVAAKIQEHVASMHERVKEGRGLRFWDELFVAIFNKYDQIRMTVEKTEKGVKVVETSDDKAVVLLIQAHAEVVSQFVAHGFDEAHKNHPVPAVAPAASKLEFPIIPKQGGVLPRPKAVEQPRASQGGLRCHRRCQSRRCQQGTRPRGPVVESVRGRGTHSAGREDHDRAARRGDQVRAERRSLQGAVSDRAEPQSATDPRASEGGCGSPRVRPGPQLQGFPRWRSCRWDSHCRGRFDRGHQQANRRLFLCPRSVKEGASTACHSNSFW
jgi:ubiquinone/menaquinone biosynthesis C-methylase UbiE